MNKLRHIYTTLTIVFLVAFPKGGIKINEIPVTWGYLLLFLPVLYCLVNINIDKWMRPRLLAYSLSLPFVIYSLLIISFSSIESVGYFISYIVSIILMPFVFLITFHNIFQKLWFRKLFVTIFKNCIRFVILFGVFLFLYKQITGLSFEIPYLTVNVDDYGLIDLKYNSRGEYFKLMSTYNNGNIFGVCMLIISPLYVMLEKKSLFKILFWIAIFLTLSRTVWIGILLFSFLFLLKYIKTKKGIFILVISFCFIFLVLPFAVYFFNFQPDFLIDKSFGGRIGQLSDLEGISFFGNFEFETIREIVYLSIIKHFGLIGFFLFLLYIFSPLITCMVYHIKGETKWGIIIYIILCASDGAMLLIPVMAFFWFVSSFMLTKK